MIRRKMANTLFLRLESPLQSWGEDSQWSERRTSTEPTKSGIVGLLACALGWNDDEHISELSKQIRVGVRHDVRGTPAPLNDYHSVGGGHSEPQLLNAKGILKLSNGKPHTEITWRYYLCDALFLVAVRSDSITIDKLAQAIQLPIWAIYLGRKSCIPTIPPFDGVGEFDSLRIALEKHPARVLDRTAAERVIKHPRIVIECEAGQGIRRHDQIVSRNLRRFEPRYSFEDRLSNEIQIEYLD
jgi:CRISPR system Cascade subunit CasD